MVDLNEEKKKAIMKFLEKKLEEWYTTNQIAVAVDIHIYKAEVLLNQLFFNGKVESDRRGKYSFWRTKQ